jgi:alpha-beta hydrolase superfamily lysophospholipase
MERSQHRIADREGRHEGLAYAVWLPDQIETGAPGVVIVHGAGSRKENHADFARLATAAGWAALTFDLPGHGASDGAISGDAVDDVIRMAHLRSNEKGIDSRRVAVRGSSLGGFLAISAAARAREIAGVIAICPASPDHLGRGVRRGDLEMRIGDPVALEAWLTARDLGEAVERISGRPLILMHAEGDIQIPSDHSLELFERASEPRKLVIAHGGTHRSVQHDPELQAMALRWLERQLSTA